MKGTLQKNKDNQWSVTISSVSKESLDEYQLHPDDVNELIDINNIFDNLEARIAANPEIDFDVVECQKMNDIVKYAKLVKVKPQ